jgi:hypothetical protein
MLLTLLGALVLSAPTFDGEDLDAAARQLRAAYPDARARAVRKLAKLQDPKAWELVRRALEDSDPQVADAAQRVMGEVTDARVLAGWLGRGGLRDRDEWVRLRIAEAVGRVALPVEARDLSRALAPREVDLSRALCASLERLALAGNLRGELKRSVDALDGILRRAKDPNLRADALAALVALDPDGARARLDAALVDRESLLQAAALRLLATGDGQASFGPAERHAGHTDPRVRLAAIGAIAGARNRSALELLAERLELEPRLHLRGRLVDALRGLSGMKYRDDPRPWKRWVAGLPADWEPAPKLEKAEDDDGAHTTARLGALPLPSDRICVLVDLSGSLWAERKEGRSRKELLDQELRGLLERLPRDSAFNLVPYATHPKPWRERLVEAHPRQIRTALADFENCSLTGKGNVWDALLFALSDPEVDTVLIVTDGAPTGGHRWDLTLMTELIERERRWSGVAVSSVLVDSPPRLQRRWREIAGRTGGLSIAVEFAGGGD